MITANLLQLLENNGLGEIGKDLFWEKLTLGEYGVYISSIGNRSDRGERRVQTFELYSRGKTDTAGYKRLKAIVDFLNSSYEVCSLPAVYEDGVQKSEAIERITIMPCSSITNGGLDDNNRIIWTATGMIYY